MKTKERKFKIFYYCPVPEDVKCKLQKFSLHSNERKKEIRFTYLSKKQMKRYVRQRENINTETFIPRVEGYFRLRKSRCKTFIKPESHDVIHTADACVDINGIDLDVRYKPKFFYRTKGFIFTKEKDLFLAIEKITVLPIILFLLLFGIGLYYFLPIVPTFPNTISEWIPSIDENIGKKADAEEQKSGSIKVNGFSRWIIPTGQTENIPVSLTNPEDNRCYFKFTITLDETNETLYQSQLVPPGEGIYLVNITRPLENGSYNATVLITTSDIKTGAAMNSCKLSTTIICK